MNPADTLAPVALGVMFVLGSALLLAELVSWWRRRRDPWVAMARRRRRR